MMVSCPKTRKRTDMKVVIAIDSFKGSMSSMESGMAAKEGVLRVYPDAEVVVKPLADGGEGTVFEHLTKSIEFSIQYRSISCLVHSISGRIILGSLFAGIPQRPLLPVPLSILKTKVSMTSNCQSLILFLQAVV